MDTSNEGGRVTGRVETDLRRAESVPIIALIAFPKLWGIRRTANSIALDRYEGDLIELALKESGGMVTRAARLLGFNHHQSLSSLINTRHKELLQRRSPVRKRRKHLMAHPKRKKKAIIIN